MYIKDVDHLGNWQFQVSIEISSSLTILVKIIFCHLLYIFTLGNFYRHGKLIQLEVSKFYF